MRIYLFTGLLVAGLIQGSGIALAQNSPGAPPMKAIGKPSTAPQDKSDLIQSLIVMNSRGATLQGDKLTLTGIAPNSIIFSDRPVRLAGHELTSDLIKEWGNGTDSFGKDPPNATVSAFKKDGSTVKDAVVVLKLSLIHI